MNKDLLLGEATGTADIDGNHRYSLSRTWAPELPMVMFIGVNPSRADATYNDATIRRCINFARSWGYGGMWFGNLYSYRTPYPSELIKNLDTACNDRTDQALIEMISKSERVICSWGNWKFAAVREKRVLELIENPYCMGKNANGSPKHPLYLPNITQPTVYVP